MRSQKVYQPAERPDVLVFFETDGPIGIWRQGELRQWLQDDNGEWWGNVQYRPDEPSRMLGTFPASRIRPDD